MISTPDRETAVTLIEEAVAAGARKRAACQLLGLSLRTLQRWTQAGCLRADGRPSALRPKPHNKLSEAERAAILEVANSARFASLPPTQIVPILADEGTYLASERTLYRLLHECSQQHHRGRAAAPVRREPPRHCATAQNEIWCWDITWLPGPARGLFFYLYLILDLYSRKIVGWEVYEAESGENAAQVLHKAVLTEQPHGTPRIYHADNSSPMKAASLQVLLDTLGITPSYSRPHVSDDNAHVEALFRTCKYRPCYPRGGFATIEAAREWVLGFVQWYNAEHRHRALKFVTPNERHSGLAHEVVAKRHAL